MSLTRAAMRRIVGREVGPDGAPVDRLECGHAVPLPVTTPTRPPRRRRCAACGAAAAAAPPDPVLARVQALRAAGGRPIANGKAAAGAWRAGASAALRGEPADACPYAVGRMPDGRATFAHGARRAWREGWEAGRAALAQDPPVTPKEPPR